MYKGQTLIVEVNFKFGVLTTGLGLHNYLMTEQITIRTPKRISFSRRQILMMGYFCCGSLCFMFWSRFFVLLEKSTNRQRSGKGAIRDSHSKNRGGTKNNNQVLIPRKHIVSRMSSQLYQNLTNIRRKQHRNSNTKT